MTKTIERAQLLDALALGTLDLLQIGYCGI